MKSPVSATNAMMIVGLIPLGLWLTVVAAMGGVPRDLTWMGFLAVSGLVAYGAAVFVAGIAAVQVIRYPGITGRPTTVTWLLIFLTGAAVVGPLLYWAVRGGV